MIKWNYKSETNSSNGYEDVIDLLKTYTRKEYETLDDASREKYVNEVFEIYRGKNIYPITYYNEDGIKDEIRKCINKDIEWYGNILNVRNTQGSSLCKFLFPNLHEVNSNCGKSNSMYKRFYDDNLLKKSIKLSLQIKKSVTPSEIRSAMELIGGTIPTNFPPIKAKALYERYCPKNGVIYDFASGFGGRMLGALSSKNNYSYIGVEPCVETFNKLNELGKHIEEVTGRIGSYKVECIGSEDYKGIENSIDFAFSSPPYFDLEVYSDEKTQCYNKYPTLELWLDGYVKDTITNIYNMLKDGCYYAVNIADFKHNGHDINYVDRWIELSKEIGFKYVEKIDMRLSTRVGDGHDGEKKEGIFVFKK